MFYVVKTHGQNSWTHSPRAVGFVANNEIKN